MTESSGRTVDDSTEQVEGVLVGYDGSPAAGTAVRWAASEAMRRGRPLVVVHAIDTWGVEIDRGVASDEWSRSATQAARNVVDEGVHLAAEAAKGVRVHGMLGDGSPTRVLVEQSRGADLVVVGNRGRGALAAAWLGSVSLAVATHAHCPTVIVGTEASAPIGPRHPVVVGVDGSDASREALDAAATLAESSGSPLRIVSVWDRMIERDWGALYASAVPGGSYGIDEAVRSSARKATADAQTRVHETHPAVSVTTDVIEGVAAQALADAAADAGVLVVGSRGHGAFAGLVLGSVSHGVVHRARCPVMVVHHSVAARSSHGTAPVHVLI